MSPDLFITIGIKYYHRCSGVHYILCRWKSPQAFRKLGMTLNGVGITVVLTCRVYKLVISERQRVSCAWSHPPNGLSIMTYLRRSVEHPSER